MATRNSPAVRRAEQELVITRVFDSPRELAFKVWTDPKHLAQWWGPNGFTNPVCEVDARRGGAIRIHMRGPDGTVYPMTGVYRKVVEPERLVFASSALDTEKDAKTALTVHSRVVTSTAEAAPYLKGMEEGWTQSLERLGEYLRSTFTKGR
jgi:uncharacterized protein YndB with AHSA1/START domain